MAGEERNRRGYEGNHKRRSASGRSGGFHRGRSMNGSSKGRNSRENRHEGQRFGHGAGNPNDRNNKDRSNRTFGYSEHHDRRQDNRSDGHRRFNRDDRYSSYRDSDRDNNRRDSNHRGRWGKRDSDSRHGGARTDRSDYQGRYNRRDNNDNRHSYQRREDSGRSWQDSVNEGKPRRRSYQQGGRQESGQSHSYDRNQYSGHRRERGSDRGSLYQDGPRRNSDGTISYPSQNPYTDPRPGEPKMPKGLEWFMLSKDDKERLRGLSKEHAENIGLHLLAAYALEETDPDQALAHAQWVARQASRVDISRETLALIAYRQGNYKLALKEFRTAYRMNGYLDYLPFIADCERGLGNPKKAIEEATSPEGKALRGESKAEMFLVYAGAFADLGMINQAIETVHQLAMAKGLSGDYRMRAVQAEQNFLEQAGRDEESHALDALLDKLESEYADDDDLDAEIVIDNDLEHANDAMMESLNILMDGASSSEKHEQWSQDVSDTEELATSAPQNENSDSVTDDYEDAHNENVRIKQSSGMPSSEYPDDSQESMDFQASDSNQTE